MLKVINYRKSVTWQSKSVIPNYLIITTQTRILHIIKSLLFNYKNPNSEKIKLVVDGPWPRISLRDSVKDWQVF